MENEKNSDKQLEALGINYGYNMVLAGPGCGKTYVLAERIAKNFECGSVNISDMLCLTFTNRAAREMYNRIKSRLGDSSLDLFVGNVHRYCSHFLFENNIVSSESSVLDEDDTKEILTSEISDREIKFLISYDEEDTFYGSLVSVDWDIVNNLLGIDIQPSGSTGRVKQNTALKIISQVRYKVMEMEHLIFQINKNHPQSDWLYKDIIESDEFKCYYPFISDFQSACKDADYDSSKYIHQNPIEKLISLASKYGNYKKANNLLDFDDLLLLTYDSYSKDKENKYKRYKWVQVDEIQDLSNFQISLIDLLTDKSDNFNVVYFGDEQQAIYSFMGASLNTLDMLKERCLNHIYRLDKNFRSPKYLLDLYNEYAVKSLHVDKDFLPVAQDKVEAGFYDLCIHDYDSPEEETYGIYKILPFLTKEEHPNEKTAILVPWNSDANEISDMLNTHKIKHFKISGLDSFQTVHIKTLFAHFNAVVNDFNLIAWARIMKETYATDNYSQARHLIEEMRKIAMCPSDLISSNGTYLANFVEIFDNEEIVLYDTETTGVDVFDDDIVQIAAIKLRNGVKVPNSDFNIFLKTEKKIPEKLGPIVNPMVEEYKKREKYDRKEGLTMFMEYIGNAVLLGHNVNYDYNILKYNIKKYCKITEFEAVTLDTLKLAHLIRPRLRKYKLGYLIDNLHLKVEDSNIADDETEAAYEFHLADNDIMATYELAKYCRNEAPKYLNAQYEFFQREYVSQVADELWNGYRECYEYTKSRLYEIQSSDENYALVKEMIEVSDKLSKICEFRLVDKFNIILSYFNHDVISREEPNALMAQLNNHLMDMSTYKEADLCNSKNIQEKLFVSTVHKAKGLEFDNVIVSRAIDGRYPHFAHHTVEKQNEDMRLFYVAISRAKKRLIITGASSKGFTPFIDDILHRFTLRFQLGQKVLVEIGPDEMKIIEDKQVVRNYRNINRIYDSVKIKNQFDFKRYMCLNCWREYELVDKLDNLFQHYGILPEHNN